MAVENPGYPPLRAGMLAAGAHIVPVAVDEEGLRPLDALQTLDRDASVLYVGTFSKSLFAALRVGYVVAPAWAREVLTAVRLCADSGGNAQLHDALGHFIVEGHLARYVRSMRRVYAERRQLLLDGLAEDLGSWLEPLPAEAGIHLATRIRTRSAAVRLIARAREHTPGAQRRLTDLQRAAIRAKRT